MNMTQTFRAITDFIDYLLWNREKKNQAIVSIFSLTLGSSVTRTGKFVHQSLMSPSSTSAHAVLHSLHAALRFSLSVYHNFMLLYLFLFLLHTIIFPDPS